MSNTPRLFLNAKDAALALAIGRSTFYALIREGLIASPTKIGARSVWPVASIEQAAQRIVAKYGTAGKEEPKKD